jgi:hypothetical protein
MLQQSFVLALDDFESTDAAADINADALCVFIGHRQAGAGKRIVAGRDRQLDEAPHLLDLFFLDELRWIEMFDFAGNLAVEQGRIEGFDARDTTTALEQRLPGLFRGVAHRGQQTDAGDYNSAGYNDSPLTRLERANHPGATAAGHGIGCPDMAASGRLTGFERPGE